MEADLRIPKSLMEAVKYFSEPEAAWQFVKRLLWPDGVVTCPFCNHRETSFLSTRQSWKCKACKKQFSVKTNTIFQGSPLPLETWLSALWLLTNCKNGISSYELASSLGVSQQTAWYMGHRIRHAMKIGTFRLMSGEVEVDETHIGGRASEMHADRRRAMRERGFPKICVMGMKERGGEVRTMVIENTESETVHRAVYENVEAGSNLYSDAHRSYIGMEVAYRHDTVNHDAGEYVRDGVSTNGIEGYWSGLKRTYHGSYIHYSDTHASRYLAEQEFRFNNREMRAGERFAALVASVGGKRLSYRELVESGLENLAPVG